MKRRIEELDIIKATCIIGIVCSHAGHALGWIGYFYVFGFYFTAGVTWRDKPFFTLLTSKVKRIYIPFVIANLTAGIFCILLHHFTGYQGGTYPVSSYILSVLLFNIRESVMAPSWFLFPLFCIQFLFFFLKKLIRNNAALLFVTFLLCTIVVYYRDVLNQFCWNNCAVPFNFAVGLFVFTCGFVYGLSSRIRDFFSTGKYSFDLFLLSVFLLFEAKYYWNYSCNLRAGMVSNALWMFITYLTGICFLICFSHIIVSKNSFCKKVLTFIGKKSMSIMFFHVLCFSIVTFVGIYVLHDTFETSWANAFLNKWYPYANIAVGLSVPLAADLVFEIWKKKIQGFHTSKDT